MYIIIYIYLHAASFSSLVICMLQHLSLHFSCQDEPHEKPHRCWHFQLAQWFEIWLGDPGSHRYGHSQLAAHRAN